MRDPRLNPEPGDVLVPTWADAARPVDLRKKPGMNDLPRTVMGCPPGAVAYRTAANRPVTHCLIMSWRQWCERTDAKPQGSS